MPSRFDEMPKETRERLLRIGKRLQTKSLPFVKWNGKTNTFEINERSVLHSQWIALVDQATMGWVKWNFNFTKTEDKTPTVCIYTHEELQQPEKSGSDVKNMWRPNYELPLQEIETEELAIFSSGHEWTRQAIGAAIEYFGKSSRRPIVQLETRETVKDGQTVIIGALDIVAPDDSDDLVVDITKAGGNSGTATPKKRNSDMDDDIPFVLAFVIASAVTWLTAGGTLIA